MISRIREVMIYFLEPSSTPASTDTQTHKCVHMNTTHTEIHIQRHIHTETHIEIHTQSHRDTCTSTHTHTHTHTAYRDSWNLNPPITRILFWSWNFILFIFLKKMYLFIMYTVFCLSVCLLARRGHQISLQMAVSHPCGCWELNSGLLEEQAMLLTAEPSLQPPFLSFLRHGFSV